MKTFYKGAAAALLTYDITDEKSFTDLEYWYKQISKLCIWCRIVLQERNCHNVGWKQIGFGQFEEGF